MGTLTLIRPCSLATTTQKMGSGKKGGMTENQDIGNGHIRIPIPRATIGFPINPFLISPFLDIDISEMDISEIQSISVMSIYVSEIFYSYF
jgi:hypothetical protein